VALDAIVLDLLAIDLDAEARKLARQQ